VGDTTTWTYEVAVIDNPGVEVLAAGDVLAAETGEVVVPFHFDGYVNGTRALMRTRLINGTGAVCTSTLQGGYTTLDVWLGHPSQAPS
jgi:hypothetical protein